MQKIVVKGYIVNEQGKILLVKRSSSDSILPGYWEVPGGGVDFGEKPIDALKREIKEETGLIIIVEYPLYVESLVLENLQQKQAIDIFFLCRVNSDNQAVLLSSEHSDYRWVDKSNITVTPMTEWMNHVFVNIAQHPLVKDIL